MKETEVQDIMTKSLVTLNANDTLDKASDIFAKHTFHHIPILDDDGSLCGIISVTDYERIKIGATLFRNPNKEALSVEMLRTMRCCDIMTKDLVHIQPTDSITAAYQLFKNKQIRALPVVGKGQLQGLVTQMDILNHLMG